VAGAIPKDALNGILERMPPQIGRTCSHGVLKRPEVEELIAAAMAQSKQEWQASGRGKLIIRAISAKQRPRRREQR